jgi:hypothetical protein
MLIIYLKLFKLTARFAVFRNPELSEGIVYLPKAEWRAMGSPTQIANEVSPWDE